MTQSARYRRSDVRIVVNHQHHAARDLVPWRVVPDFPLVTRRCPLPDRHGVYGTTGAGAAPQRFFRSTNGCRMPVTSAWVKRYVDVDADTPDETPARSAALQSGGLRAGSSAMADGIAPNSTAPAIAPAPRAPATARRPVRIETNMVKLLHRKRRDRNHG